MGGGLVEHTGFHLCVWGGIRPPLAGVSLPLGNQIQGIFTNEVSLCFTGLYDGFDVKKLGYPFAFQRVVGRPSYSDEINKNSSTQPLK